MDIRNTITKLVDGAHEDLTLVTWHDPMQGYMLHHDLNVAIEERNLPLLYEAAKAIWLANRGAQS